MSVLCCCPQIIPSSTVPVWKFLLMVVNRPYLCRCTEGHVRIELNDSSRDSHCSLIARYFSSPNCAPPKIFCVWYELHWWLMLYIHCQAVLSFLLFVSKMVTSNHVAMGTAHLHSYWLLSWSNPIHSHYLTNSFIITYCVKCSSIHPSELHHRKPYKEE